METGYGWTRAEDYRPGNVRGFPADARMLGLSFANDYDTTAKNVMLDALGAVAVRLALHTGDPGGANSASNEVSGGGYARATIAWAAAGSGTMDMTSAPAISVPAATTISWISLWNSGGTVRYLKKDVTDEAFTNAGTYTVTDGDLDLNDA